ncbi:MAG: ABC transporter substrate-binding protein [Pseudonocardiaceae bacterium]
MSADATVSRRTVLAAAVALITAGCTSAAGSASSAELAWATGGVNGADRDGALDVVARWHALYPNGPKVGVEPLPLSTNEQQELLGLELNAGLSNLDVLSLDVVWIPEFAQRGWLVDLHELRSEIEQVSLPGPVRAAVWNGTLWAAPTVTDVGILYYRSDLVGKPPTTWQELIATGRQVGERNGIAPFVADGKQYEGLVVQYLEYFWGLGGEVFDRDGQSVLFQPDKALQALEFMRSAFLEGVYAPGFNTMDQEDARKTFQNGDAVFLRSWPYAYREMTGGDPDSQVVGKVGVAPLPTFPGHGPVAALGGHNMAVSAFSRNIPAATEFARFVSTSRDVQLATFQRQSLAPTMKGVYRDLVGDPLVALLATVLPTARPRPATTQWATISSEMQQQIFAAYTGDSDPKGAVDALRNFLIATVKGS